MNLGYHHYGLPYNCFAMRHGRSIGNRRHDLSAQGEYGAFTQEFRMSNGSQWQLGPDGIEQSVAAKNWFQTNNLITFDEYHSSDYLRAAESGARLGLLNAKWQRSVLLREREWGWLDNMTKEERWKTYPNEMPREHDRVQKFWWKIPNGESYADVAQRALMQVNSLRREVPLEHVLIVAHIELMETLRYLFEDMNPYEFGELTDDPTEKIHNYQILHYSRRDEFGKVYPTYVRRRSICPWDETKTDNRWKPITSNLTMTNDEMLRMVEQYKFVDDYNH